VEERSFFLGEAARMESRGWTRAARIAHRHVSSRLNALTLLPTAVRMRHRSGTRRLARHAFGGWAATAGLRLGGYPPRRD
ncbi:MAG: hypothetical protein M3186_16430, partial [Actinomycetota bacterium]|nr:hypothetical protein [Actinomycetota bacterium]